MSSYLNAANARAAAAFALRVPRPSPRSPHPLPLAILLADGLRPDTLDRHLASGTLPGIAALRAGGTAHVLTTVFPSVTGPAYLPFFTGEFPGPLGVPGLRWFDRSRRRCSYPHYTRSYLGAEMRHMTGDLDPGVPTLFERVGSRYAALSIITRGLSRPERLGDGLGFVWKAARAHVRGRVASWLDIDRYVARTVVRRMRREPPDLLFAAFMGVDKSSHEQGAGAPAVLDALRIVDDTVAELQANTGEQTSIWVVSDHGHDLVETHDDLADAVRAAGWRTIAHPWVYGRWDVAVMVSGNAMAHLYLGRAARAPQGWPALEREWTPLVDLLLDRPSIDLIVLPHRPGRCEVRRAGHGRAVLERHGERYAYRPDDGDPLGIGEHEGLDADEAWDVCIAGAYPDALVQLLSLAGSRRSGDVIVSAAPRFDLRARFEPIPHASAHGSLRRAHMLVPFIGGDPLPAAPRRTADLMQMALRTITTARG